MFFLNFVVFILALLIIFIIFDKVIRTILNIKKEEGWTYKYVHKSQKIGEGIIIAVFFIALIAGVFYESAYEPFILIIIYMVVLHLYRAFMEWKYAKESKEYIITFSQIVLFTVTMYLIVKLGVPALIFK